MPDPITRLNAALGGRYHVERELGEGGMATVYLADDLKHERKVALKVLKPELAAVVGADRFLAEIKTTANLQHPHILPLFDSGEADGLLYYVMPYVEGESLRDKLDRETQLSVEEALAVCHKVASALDYAHSHGVVHRDIKPGNILISEQGEPLVADFGIALAVGSVDGARLTETGLSIGTPAYMSPEQGLENQEVDGRSDLYSLACVLFEMLAGDPPFTGRNPIALMVRKTTETPPALRTVRATVPQHVENAVHRALATVPADRFASAGAFRETLLASHTLESPRSPLSVWSRAALVAAVLALGVISWNMFTGVTSSSERIESLAILPLANLSRDSAQQVLLDGIHDRLIGEFYRVDSLRTISRTSVLSKAAEGLTILDLARELDVDAVIEGAAELTPGGVRVQFSLIGAGSSERRLWSQSYTRSAGGLLSLPSDVVRDMIDALGLELPASLASGASGEPTTIPGAADAYELGDAFFRSYENEEALRSAIEQYDLATDLDPTFALAHAKESLAHSWMWWWWWDRSEARLSSSRSAAAAALRLDPDLAEAHMAQGFHYSVQVEPTDSALMHYQVARESRPNDPSLWVFTGVAQRPLGMEGEALESLSRAVELDPSNGPIIAELGWTMLGYGLLAEAEGMADRVLALQPNYTPAILLRATVQTLRAESVDPAVQTIREGVDRLGGGPFGTNADQPVIYLAGVADDSIRLALERAGPAPQLLQNTADYHLVVGDILRMSGDTAGSEREFRRALSIVDSITAAGLNEREISVLAAKLHRQRGVALAGLGDADGAVREGEEAVRRLPLEASADFGTWPARDLARIYTMVGRHDDAIDLLTTLVEGRHGLTSTMIRLHPWFTALRGHPRFQDLIEL